MLGSLALPDLLANKRWLAGWLHRQLMRMLLLQGSPPHIEFFDPKMTAPKEIRSITGEVKTNIPVLWRHVPQAGEDRRISFPCMGCTAQMVGTCIR